MRETGKQFYILFYHNKEKKNGGPPPPISNRMWWVASALSTFAVTILNGISPKRYGSTFPRHFIVQTSRSTLMKHCNAFMTFILLNLVYRIIINFDLHLRLSSSNFFMTNINSWSRVPRVHGLKIAV